MTTDAQRRAAILTSFRSQFPAASYPDLAVSDDIVNLAIPVAEAIHSKASLATLYLVAHLITVRPENGETLGEVSSEAIGPKTINYITQATEGPHAFYTRTEYGRQFLEMERRVTSGVFAVGVY